MPCFLQPVQVAARASVGLGGTRGVGYAVGVDPGVHELERGLAGRAGDPAAADYPAALGYSQKRSDARRAGFGRRARCAVGLPGLGLRGGEVVTGGAGRGDPRNGVPGIAGDLVAALNPAACHGPLDDGAALAHRPDHALTLKQVHGLGDDRPLSLKGFREIGLARERLAGPVFASHDSPSQVVGDDAIASGHQDPFRLICPRILTSRREALTVGLCPRITECWARLGK